jgi:peptidoglycan/LPS O-acetylase OafA/YrhL
MGKGLKNKVKHKRLRSDIQILRCLAVVAVVLYHFWPNKKYWAGGYVGVDIFFVISGFLMIQIIIKSLEKIKLENYNKSAQSLSRFQININI